MRIAKRERVIYGVFFGGMTGSELFIRNRKTVFIFYEKGIN